MVYSGLGYLCVLEACLWVFPNGLRLIRLSPIICPLKRCISSSNCHYILSSAMLCRFDQLKRDINIAFLLFTILLSIFLISHYSTILSSNSFCAYLESLSTHSMVSSNNPSFGQTPSASPNAKLVSTSNPGNIDIIPCPQVLNMNYTLLRFFPPSPQVCHGCLTSIFKLRPLFLYCKNETRRIR